MSSQTGHEPWAGRPDALPLALFGPVTLLSDTPLGKLAHSQPPVLAKLALGPKPLPINTHQSQGLCHCLQEWPVRQSAGQGDSANGTLASRPQVPSSLLSSGHLNDPRASLFPLTLIPMAFRPETSRTSAVK